MNINILKNILCLFVLFFLNQHLNANGVAVVNATDNSNLTLISSNTEVEVINQVSIISTTQIFRNEFATDTTIKYAYPLPEKAVATGLKWRLNGLWYQANFAPSPTDTVLPTSGGGSIDPNLELYLGASALFFELNQEIPVDSTLLVELEYVMLLPYFSNSVKLELPNDYSSIQTDVLDKQKWSISILSDRPIVGADLISHSGATVIWDPLSISMDFELLGLSADQDFEFVYQLDPDYLGLFGFSTMLPDSLEPCDDFGKGYFAFLAEPEQTDSIIISKVITMVIDQSGSMSGTKYAQAKDAALFIINNLNSDDEFNIILFQSGVTSWRPDHVSVSPTNISSAIAFVNSSVSSGGTNMAGALEEAIPDFNAADLDKDNVMIFLTDGLASNSNAYLLDLTNGLIAFNSAEALSIFTFGIGTGVNHALLSQLATDHNGVAAFLGSSDLLTVLSEFYAYIDNPVLLNTWITFSPDTLVSEVYPFPLPNLYGGQQLLVTGRYKTPDSVMVNISGLNGADTVTYSYPLSLAGTVDPQLYFLTKLWAIQKINSLMVDFYSSPTGSVQADSLEDAVVDLSFCYGVISPFTSFTQNGGGPYSVGLEELEEHGKKQITIYPNPGFANQVIEFNYNGLATVLSCAIYDVSGKLVAVLDAFAKPGETAQFRFDGLGLDGAHLQAGTYL
ncbi:MAG: Ca-activated chloride channel family protein, partial [Limisphaerales bacterium]